MSELPPHKDINWTEEITVLGFSVWLGRDDNGRLFAAHAHHPYFLFEAVTRSEAVDLVSSAIAFYRRAVLHS